MRFGWQKIEALLCISFLRVCISPHLSSIHFLSNVVYILPSINSAGHLVNCSLLWTKYIFMSKFCIIYLLHSLATIVSSTFVYFNPIKCDVDIQASIIFYKIFCFFACIRSPHWSQIELDNKFVNGKRKKKRKIPHYKTPNIFSFNTKIPPKPKITITRTLNRDMSIFSTRRINSIARHLCAVNLGANHHGKGKVKVMKVFRDADGKGERKFFLCVTRMWRLMCVAILTKCDIQV